jgi:aminocarboxymuconate-semialdehyde decarboxylase
VPLDRIDVHTHILPPAWPDLRARFGYGGWPQLESLGPGRARIVIDGRVFREVGDDSWDPARRLEDCDRTGVRLQVLSTVPVMFAYDKPAADAAVVSRLLNDHIAEVVAERPDRFAGLGTIPLQDVDLAISELERCVTELGLDGVQIGTHVGDRNLDDAAIEAVLAAAEELGAAVFVHPWDMLAPERMTRHWLPWLVGMPAELALAIASVVLGGVLDRHPDLRLLFAHGGGAFPGSLGRVEAGFHARPDLVATATDTEPRDAVRRIYVDSLTHDPDALRFIAGIVGEDRIALGTDYPFPLGEAVPGATIEALTELSPEARTLMLAGTAQAFLGRAVPGGTSPPATSVTAG